MKLSQYEPMSEWFKTLSNPVRLALLFCLKGEPKNATQLCEILNLSKANLSQHINRLKKEGFVICVKEGTFCFYSLSDPSLIKMLEKLKPCVLGSCNENL